MRVGFLHVLVLLALVAQYQPLRVCVVEQWLNGSNCHEREHALVVDLAGDLDTGGHRPHAPHEACACDAPKDSSERQRAATSIDAPVLAERSFTIEPAGATSVTLVSGFAHPPDFPARIASPLLL